MYARSEIKTQVSLDEFNGRGVFSSEGKSAMAMKRDDALGITGKHHKNRSDVQRMHYLAQQSAQKEMLSRAWTASSGRESIFSEATSWIKETSRKVMGYLNHGATTAKALISDAAAAYANIASNFARSPAGLGLAMANLKTTDRLDMLQGTGIVGNLMAKNEPVPAHAVSIGGPRLSLA